MANDSAIDKRVENFGWMRAMDLACTNVVVPPTLRTAVSLKVFDILAKNKVEMSAREIVGSIKANYNFSILNMKLDESLDRLLRALATSGLLAATTTREEEGQGGKITSVRKYGLNAVSFYLVGGEQGGPSFAPMVSLGQHKSIQKSFESLGKAIVDGSSPLSLNHDGNVALFSDEDHDFAKLFNSSMDNHSRLFMPFLLSNYVGFQQVKTLVDVGGGNGASIASIVSKYPHIQGINFDHPHVVASAPSYPGVTHIGGNMFESIPQADAIFMKWILHNWSDEMCVKTLKNCYNALPKNGKVIIIDSIQDLAVETTRKGRMIANMDLLMFALTDGGKERCKHEFFEIAKAAGFGDVKVLMRIQEFYVMELYKS